MSAEGAHKLLIIAYLYEDHLVKFPEDPKIKVTCLWLSVLTDFGQLAIKCSSLITKLSSSVFLIWKNS